jgi:hypothetical protein
MPWHRERDTFHTSAKSVLELLDFDRVIIALAVDGLRNVASHIERSYNLPAAVITLNNRAEMLEQVRKGDSLRPKYETIFNQCVVLLVSYFDSAVHGVFRCAVIEALRTDIAVPVKSEKLSVSWSALEQTHGDRERIFADLLVAQKNISFQDMQSVVRTFKDLLNITLPRTTHTDNIILGQAARHAIVHARAIVDDRMVNQVAAAKLRTLKPEVVHMAELRFTPEEVNELSVSMTVYVQDLCSALDAKACDR